METRKMKTTAQLRNEAHDAYVSFNWSLAADLYDQALAAYPAHHAGSQLAIKDKEALKNLAARCRGMAE